MDRLRDSKLPSHQRLILVCTRPEVQLMGSSRIAVLIPSSFFKSSSFSRHVFSHFILLCKEASRKSSLPKPSNNQRSIGCQQDIAQPKKVTTTCVTLYSSCLHHLSEGLCTVFLASIFCNSFCLLNICVCKNVNDLFRLCYLTVPDRNFFL